MSVFPGLSWSPISAMALFRRLQAGMDLKKGTRTEFSLKYEEWNRIKDALLQDDELRRFVETKVQIDIYDYIGSRRRLVVRRPTQVHRLFLESVENAIESQLQVIRSGTGRRAQFAQKIRASRPSTMIFPAKSTSNEIRHDPDACFKHTSAKYPGFVIEISNQVPDWRLGELCKQYIATSDDNVQVVICLFIAHHTEGSRRAMYFHYRSLLWFNTVDEVEVSRAVLDRIIFRDDEGNPTNKEDLQLNLSDFASKSLAKEELGGEDAEISISCAQLCRFLDEAEAYAQESSQSEDYSLFKDE